MLRNTILILTAALISQVSLAEGYDFKTISKKYPSVAYDKKTVTSAKMEGECLVGLKELNFRKKLEFDPVAEWTTYRTSALLRQFAPCTVLIIMEVAQSMLKNDITLK